MGGKLFILGLVSFMNFMAVDAQWKIEKSATEENLNAVFIVNSNSGWIVGDNGTILGKAGNVWLESRIPADENLYSIHMLDENYGWAVGARGTIVRFDGRNWQSSISPTNKDLYSVYFSDRETGVAVGELGTVLVYKNGTWDKIESNIKGNLHSAFISENDIWIGGGLECVNVPIMKMKLEDASVLKYESLPFATINSLFFTNPYNGWAVGSPSSLLHFNGSEWVEPALNVKCPSLIDVYFSDENNGICVGFEGTILTLTNGEWLREKSPVRENLNAVYGIGEDYYVVGDKGTILKRNHSASATLSYMPDKTPENIILYPSPGNEIVNLIVKSGNENLKGIVLITNNGGQLIFQKEIVTGDGQFFLPLATADLPDGIYFCKININGRVTTRKFVVIH